MNHVEFRLQFIKNSTTGKYDPIVALYDVKTNRVIGTKSFTQEIDAEIYKRQAQKKLICEQNGYNDIVNAFNVKDWFVQTETEKLPRSYSTEKETITQLACVIEDLLASVSIYLRKD